MSYKLFIHILMLCLIFSSCNKYEDMESKYINANDINEQDDDKTTMTIDDNYIYKLPVIFHVFYTAENDSVYSLSARLKDILHNVNDIYSGGVYGESEDIRVDFQLASSDENGNRLATPGVEFIKWSGTFPVDPNKFMTSSDYKHYIWEPNEYINVMLFPFTHDNTTTSTVLGISHMPYTLDDDTKLEGLEVTGRQFMTKSNLNFPYCSAINSIYINNESTRYTVDKNKNNYRYSSADANVTLAHELGHYLGLRHVFTEEKKSGGDGNYAYEAVDSCSDSDYCGDTPSYNKPDYDNYLNLYMKQHQGDGRYIMKEMASRFSCEGTPFFSENIMDYAISYSNRLSPEQKQRIRHVLYYSPLIPGPKKNIKSTRTIVEDDSIIALPIVTTK